MCIRDRSFGVRKRKLDEDEEEQEQAAAKAYKNNWGSSLKAYPGAMRDNQGEDDIDALLSGATGPKGTRKNDVKEESLEQSNRMISAEEVPAANTAAPTSPQVPDEPAVQVKSEEDEPVAEPAILFKKRKAPKR